MADKKRWLVEFEFEAFVDLEGVKSRGDRKAVINVVNKLRLFGPELTSPSLRTKRASIEPFGTPIGASAGVGKADDKFIIATTNGSGDLSGDGEF